MESQPHSFYITGAASNEINATSTASLTQAVVNEAVKLNVDYPTTLCSNGGQTPMKMDIALGHGCGTLSPQWLVKCDANGKNEDNWNNLHAVTADGEEIRHGVPFAVGADIETLDIFISANDDDGDMHLGPATITSTSTVLGSVAEGLLLETIPQGKLSLSFNCQEESKDNEINVSVPVQGQDNPLTL